MTHRVSAGALLALTLLAASASVRAQGALWDAITQNQTARIENLLRLPSIFANVNQRNSYGNPLLHHAVGVGNPKVVEWLIAKGADVNAKGQFDRTALHFANKNGVAKILLQHGAIVDAPTNYGETPLHWAAQGINSLDKEANLLEFARILMDHGADINRQAGPGRSFKTPLNYAAQANNLPVAKLLIDRRVDVEAGGSSPLTSAGENGDFVEMARLLVEHGAKVNALSREGRYPIQGAIMRCNVKVARYLLAQGANPNSVDQHGVGPLRFASGSESCAPIVESLLERGADPNAKNSNGMTALHFATAGRDAKTVVNLLLAAKADVNAATKQGRTPLGSVVENIVAPPGFRLAVAEVLLKNGADPNNAPAAKTGEIPLLHAIVRNDIDMVKLLLNNGADVNSTTGGHTMLQLAAKSKPITELLVEHGAK